MPFDTMVLSAVQTELNQLLPKARIDKIYQPDKMTLLLHLRQGPRNLSLVICAHAQDARIHITTHNLPNPMVPQPFCMLLRKHLEGGRIAEITQPPLERILILTINTRDEFGMTAACRLHCEFMGKHSNIILTKNPEDDWDESKKPKILGAIKLIGEEQSRYRTIFPGLEYILPPAQDKYNFLKQDLSQLPEYLTKNANIPPAKALLNSLLGLSPVMAREIAFRAGVNADNNYDAIIKEIAGLKIKLENKDFAPHWFHPDNGKQPDFFAWKMEHINASCQEHWHDMNSLLDEFFFRQREAKILEQKRQNLLRICRKALAFAERRQKKQSAGMEKAGSAEEYRRRGELLTANFYRLPDRAVDYVLVRDYTLPDFPEVKIPIDSKLTIKENARRCFNRYHRSIRAIKQLKQRLRKTGEEMNYLHEVIYSLEAADSTELLDDIASELTAEGYYTPKKDSGEKHKKNILPPRKFTSDDGYEILIGRNNRQNDKLTLRQSNPEDTWLHTKDIPGAHVIIRGENPPASTLKKAAQLAAAFSRASQSGNVPVDYTLVKHVRKPKGAHPGMVIYDSHKTIYVTPEKTTD